MASTVDSDRTWTVGSPAFGRYIAGMAFSSALFWIGGLAGVGWDVLHLPSLLGYPLAARSALCYLAWIGTGLSVGLGALLAGLQRTNDHTGSGEVTR